MKSLFLLAFLCITLPGCGLFDSDDKMNLTIYSADGNLEKVKEYMPKVRSLDFISPKGDTPLNAAIYNGHTEVVKLLINNGASCKFRDGNSQTALDIAEKRNMNQIQEYLEGNAQCIR